MKNLLLILLTICFFLPNSVAQITLISKKDKETITNGKYLSLGYVYDKNNPCCSKMLYEGTLIESFKDSIKMNVIKSELTQKMPFGMQQTNTVYDINTEQSLIKTVSKNDVKYIEVFKSKKNKKYKESFSAIGGLAVLTGLATGISALFVDKENRSDRFLSGSIQFGSGMFLLALSSTKKYKVNRESTKDWFLE